MTEQWANPDTPTELVAPALGADALAALPLPPPAAPRRRRWPLVAGIAAGVVIVLVAGAAATAAGLGLFTKSDGELIRPALAGFAKLEKAAYRGTLLDPTGRPIGVDLVVSRDESHGTVTRDRLKVEVALDTNGLQIRAPKEHWAGALIPADQLAAQWARVSAEDIGLSPRDLEPKVLADLLTKALGPAPRNDLETVKARRSTTGPTVTVNGVEARKIRIKQGNLFVTTATPHRLVRVELASLTAAADSAPEQAADPKPGTAAASPGAELALDITAPTAEQITALTNTTRRTETARAIDPELRAEQPALYHVEKDAKVLERNCGPTSCSVGIRVKFASGKPVGDNSLRVWIAGNKAFGPVLARCSTPIPRTLAVGQTVEVLCAMNPTAVLRNFTGDNVWEHVHVFNWGWQGTSPKVFEDLVASGWDAAPMFDAATLAGATGVDAAVKLTAGGTMTWPDAVLLLRRAKTADVLPAVLTLANSGKLTKPSDLGEQLNKLSAAGPAESRRISRMLQRAAESKDPVAFESPTANTVTVAKQVYAVRAATARTARAVGTEVTIAATSLANATGEKKIGEIWIDNPRNELFAAERATVIAALKKDKLPADTLRKATEFVVHNATGDHRLTPADLL